MEFENKKLRDVADIAARIMMGEKALHPNQQKLDVHEPEKDELTAKDFEMLRNKKKMKEEAKHEESCDCDDCSKEKVEEGIVDKVKSVLGQKPKSGNLFDQPHVKKDTAEYLKKSAKQPQGPNNVTNIMTKESVQQLDEATYVVKHDGVADDHKDADAKKLFAGKKNVNSHVSKYASSAEKHADMLKSKGFKNVRVQTLNKEEVEELDETTRKQVKDFHDVLGKEVEAHSLERKASADSGNRRKFNAAHDAITKHGIAATNYARKYNKEEVEEIEEMFPGTPEYEKKYGKAPQDMKKGEKKATTKGEMEKTEKGVVHRRKFSEMVESYSDGGIKGLFKTLAEEPTNAEFTAQLDDAKKRAAGTKKQPDVSKPAVQAVQNEETELTLEDYSLEELEDFILSEDFEQLDEVSKKTLKSYVKSAKQDIAGNRKDAEKFASMASAADTPHGLRGSKWLGDKAKSRGALADKRQANVDKATSRLAKEGVDNIHTQVQVVDLTDANEIKTSTIDLEERELTAAETKKKEEIVKSMKKGLAGFKERYGDRAKEVMYATATKQAKKD